MSINPRIETQEDIQIIKEFTLLPILLDMLTRDIDELQINQDKIVFSHVIFYLRELERSIYPELQGLKRKMKTPVEYKVRGYIHHFNMLRSLVKAELMTMLMNLRRRPG